MIAFLSTSKKWISARFSAQRLSVRILTIMLLPLTLFLVGLLSVDQYKRVLISAELDALQRQGIVLARSLALAEVEGRGASFTQRELSRKTMKQLLPLVGYGSVLRARVFQPNGTLAADTARHGMSAGVVQLRRKRHRDMRGHLRETIIGWLDAASALFSNQAPMPIVRERPLMNARDIPDVIHALNGKVRRNVVLNRKGHMVLSVAVPIQDLRVVRGALLVTTSGGHIEGEIRQVQWAFLQIFAVVFLITVGLALYLARSITTPIAKLANAADQLRQSHDDKPLMALPDRKDEIGKLSQALSEMTTELQRRIQATAGFAADVSHELKNPLTSLRSAVETVARIEDPEQQRKLMDVILADVGRLDRLISDISQASRIDVELNKLLPDPSMLDELVSNWVALSKDRHKGVQIEWQADLKDVPVRIFSSRIVQVLDNILQNAVSFSPDGGRIMVSLIKEDNQAKIIIEDEGPGIPPAKIDAIFDRFYTERPQSESFGNHSGLGLSISRQIAEAHKGVLYAENRSEGGARFVLCLPIAPI